MWQAIHKKIRQSFSDAALTYDVLSSLHKEIGRELIRKVMSKSCARILDVGTGTGYLANKAKFYFPEAMVVGIDIADGMVKEADKLKEGVYVIQADACALPFQTSVFDLVVSNLSYQWMADLDTAFRQANRCLNDNGEFCVTLFGRRTFEELFDVLQKAASPKDMVHRLADQTRIEGALTTAGFKNVQISEEIIRVEFKNVMDLLRWNKGIGANVLNQDIPVGKQTIAKMDDLYKTKYAYFNGICVTFEIIWIHAKK
ncbi:MAG: methyltransferase domain-containing protein [Candidatus Omnitrophica bacterium]|nr:methyltransferase domain-containing protein [Candidatus Omnitrophota bacterium]